jgi:phosphatidate cytidylyltransferase
MGPPRSRESSTVARVLVALPWAVFGVAIVVAGGTVFSLGLIGFGIVGLHELYRMLRPAHPIPLAGFAGLVALIVAAQSGDQFQLVLVSACSVALVFLAAMARGARRGITLSMAATLLGIFWIGLALAHVVLLRKLPHGDGLVIDTLIATFIGDSGAYFAGGFWGRHPLAPRISPSKTVEGMVAGMLVGTAAFWFAGLYQNWLSGIDALIIGAGVAAAAPFGDLFESMIKRDAGVKDSGRLFGEHGGVLDRLDAAFFTVVVAYYLSKAVL